MTFNEDEGFSGDVGKLEDELRTALNHQEYVDLLDKLQVQQTPQNSLEDDETYRIDESVVDMDREGINRESVAESGQLKHTDARFDPFPTPPPSPPAALLASALSVIGLEAGATLPKDGTDKTLNVIGLEARVDELPKDVVREVENNVIGLEVGAAPQDVVVHNVIGLEAGHAPQRRRCTQREQSGRCGA